MDFNELRRINETIRIAKQAQEMQRIQQLLKLSALLKQIQDARRQQEAIKEFCEENKDQFWRGEKPSEQELESLREQTGYDQKIWSDIVRELLGEPPPSNG
ncbi:MAG TPA: hypothetical protein DIS66_01100 [Candidatus Omnitrophica bacterium]|nr:hypothetical protein [Candidatus Omnitrophota bacterium]